jgi:hypothetical protein
MPFGMLVLLWLNQSSHCLFMLGVLLPCLVVRPPPPPPPRELRQTVVVAAVVVDAVLRLLDCLLARSLGGLIKRRLWVFALSLMMMMMMMMMTMMNVRRQADTSAW